MPKYTYCSPDGKASIEVDGTSEVSDVKVNGRWVRLESLSVGKRKRMEAERWMLAFCFLSLVAILLAVAIVDCFD